MSKTFEYLIYFCVYSFVILFIGKSSLGESDSISKFFVGERKIGILRLFFTFVGTWVSAATIISYTGNVYLEGTAVITISVIPWFIGAVMLFAISDRLYDCEILTIPQFIGRHYRSKGLQAATAVLFSYCYIMYLVIQIKGFGIAASSLLNIDYKVAVFLVYLFILYSTFGGFNSVTKTDACNLIMLSVSVIVIYFVILGRVNGMWVLTNRLVAEETLKAGIVIDQSDFLGGYTPVMYATMFFGWGMGLAANPQYLIRLAAARDKRTAKRMIPYALCFLAALYFGLTQIGLGLRILFPHLDTYCGTDDIFIYAVHHLLHSHFSGFFLLSVIGACISTANSQLLLIGSMMSYDVAGQLGRRPVKEERILKLTRWFIFSGGTLSLILSLNPPENSLLFGADIWGVFSVMLTPLFYGTLLYPRGTRAGAWGAFIAGVVCILVLWNLPLPVYWAFPGTMISTAVFLLIPFLERRREVTHETDI